MENIAVTINGHGVIGSGTLIAGMGAPIEIRPFNQQPDYKIIFQCRSAVLDEKKSSHIVPEGSGVKIEHINEWNGLNENIVSRTVFARSDDILYMIDYYIKLVGDPDRYSYVFSYTIYSESA